MIMSFTPFDQIPSSLHRKPIHLLWYYTQTTVTGTLMQNYLAYKQNFVLVNNGNFLGVINQYVALNAVIDGIKKSTVDEKLCVCA